MADTVSPMSLHLVRTCFTLFTRPSRVSCHMRMSSTSFSAFFIPSMMASDLWHHTSPDGASPMGALLYLYLPDGSRNVV